MSPDRKVAAGGLAGAITTLIQFVLIQVGVEMDAMTASAMTTVLMFTVSYFVPSKPGDTTQPLSGG